MPLFGTSAQNPVGFNAGPTIVGTVTMSGSAGVKGNLVTLDADLDTATLGTTAATNEKFVGVLLEDIAEDAKGRCALAGRVQVLGSPTAGVAYSAGAAGAIAAAGAGDDVLFISEETKTSALAWGYFDGVNKLGVGA